MQVILLERVEKLGQMGDEVRVKDGFARNFLLPKKKALRATKANRDYFQAQKAQLEANNLERRRRSREGRPEAGRQVLRADPPGRRPRPALWLGQPARRRRRRGKGRLQASTATRSISARRSRPIGLFTIPVVLHPEVKVNITVNVARSEDEAAARRAARTCWPARRNRKKPSPPPRRYSSKAPVRKRKSNRAKPELFADRTKGPVLNRAFFVTGRPDDAFGNVWPAYFIFNNCNDRFGAKRPLADVRY